MSMFSGEFYTRGVFLEKLQEAGYPLVNNDVTWACENNILSPIKIKSNLFGYTAEDFIWMEQLGKIKKAGLNKSVLSTIAEGDILSEVVAIVEQIQKYKK